MGMPVTQRTVTLNEFGLERRERTNAAGATGVRYSVSIDAKPLVHTFDAKALGRGPALAIAEHLRGRVAAINTPASPATVRKRRAAAKALASGESTASKRYGGGRMGFMAPGQSEMLFNDSGRTAKGIVANATKDNQWVVNFPANRFDPRTFDDGEAGVVRMFEKLVELVPEFGNPQRLANVPAVRDAIASSIALIIARNSGPGGLVDFDAVRRARLDALRAGLQLVQSLAA
jgi:hypothetical protein